MTPAGIAWRGWAILLLAIIAVPFACTVSQAQEPGAELRRDGVRLTAKGCEDFAQALEQAADAREAGIGLRLYLAYMQRRFARYVAGNDKVRDAVLYEIRRAHLSGLDGELLRADAYTRCMTGPIGEKPST